MGTTQSTPSQTKKDVKEVVDTVKKESSQDKILIDKILNKSREIYQKNKESFLDENFCKKIAITYTKKLYELPIQQVRNIYNEIESANYNLEVSTVVDPLKEEKYLVNELSGRLIERFKDKKLEPTLHKGIKITYPDVMYIQNRAIELLGNINRFEQEKKQDGGKPNYYNNNNNYNENEDYDNEFENEEEEENYNEENYNRYKKRNENSSKMSYRNRQLAKQKMWEERERKRRGEGFEERRDDRRFDDRRDERRDDRSENRRDDRRDYRRDDRRDDRRDNRSENRRDDRRDERRRNNRGEEQKTFTIEESKNFESILGELPKAQYKTPAVVKAKEELNKILSEKKPNTKVEEANVKQITGNAKPSNLRVNKLENVSFENVKVENIQKKNSKTVKNIESNGDIHCVDDKTCNLTKKEICEKIVYHFIVRNNITAAILSTVPFPSKDGEYKGSFVFERLKSLERGSFCLPPFEEIKFQNNKFDNDAAKLAYENERIAKILNYINIIDEKQCVSNGGRLLLLTKEQLQELYKNDALGKKYFDFAIKINNFYQEALNSLYNILDNLQSNVKINTQSLNDLSEATKKIIDELYLKTQFNYLLAVLVILEFKFEKNNAESEIKNRRMQNIIREDFNV